MTENSIYHSNSLVMKICSNCKSTINDDHVLKVVENYWHEHCLMCSACHGKLAHLGSTLYMKHGRMFCKNDYLRLFGPTAFCASCNQQIYGNDMIIRKDFNTVYHYTCFHCTNCKKEFCVGERCVTDKTSGQIYCLDNECKQVKDKNQKRFKKGKDYT